eukprot:GFYU01005963.1.p1 GENE.GFYU01005963.1~~GFYU01005963.1.p1  ORF type:complete len:501 (-),score=169.01 GFYU01005963.1:153-1655(-)
MSSPRAAKKQKTNNGKPSLTARAEEEISDWSARLETAEKMIPLVGQMYRQLNVLPTVFGKSLVNKSVIEIIKSHRFAIKYLETKITVHDTYPILECVMSLKPAPCRIDLGKLSVSYRKVAGEIDLRTFLTREIKNLGEKKPLMEKPRDIVLFGFGRIGRLLSRILIEKTGGGNKLLLKAVVVRSYGKGDLYKRASLLRRDSVHGPFNGTIEIDEENNCLVVNGNVVQFIFPDGKDPIDFTKYGIHDAILIENAGIARSKADLQKHLDCKGISKVILTAPAGDVPNIVAGVNDHEIKDSCDIYAAASCTTNAVVPTLKVIDEKFGLETAHIETVHSFTNDQNLIDNMHKKSRRGRSAALNMVITETGAAKAVAKALPHLAGKITGNAIRVPTPNVSLAILILNCKKESTAQEVNNYLRMESMAGPLQNQIDYSASEEIVSSDFVGSRASGVVDSKATIVKDNRVNLYVWYDNEYGYSCQVVRVVQKIAGVVHPRIPVPHSP